MNLTNLQRAVIAQLGYDEPDADCMDTLENIRNHGIDGGFHGFIYYNETIAFFDANKVDVLQLAEQLAEDIGEDMLSMIANFCCLTDSNHKPQYTATEIMKAIYEPGNENEAEIKNALAWFAAEEVARQLTDY